MLIASPNCTWRFGRTEIINPTISDLMVVTSLSANPRFVPSSLYESRKWLALWLWRIPEGGIAHSPFSSDEVLEVQCASKTGVERDLLGGNQSQEVQRKAFLCLDGFECALGCE